MNKDLTTEKLKQASIHLFYMDKEEAMREAFRTGAPYFRTFIDGQLMWTVRPRGESINNLK